MNEQIRVLKHQASVWCDENIPEQFSEETNGYGSAWEEKFAELIVRECVDVIRKEVSLKYKYGGETEEFMGGHYASSMLARVKIKNHFGVKE